MKFKAEEIAKIIHGVTSQIRRMDNSQVNDWNNLSEFQRENAANAVKKIYSDPHRTPEELHDLWMEPLIKDGWTCGEYNHALKTHPSILPFEELEDSEVLKDFIWYYLTEAFKNFYDA